MNKICKAKGEQEIKTLMENLNVWNVKQSLQGKITGDIDLVRNFEVSFQIDAETKVLGKFTQSWMVIPLQSY